MAQQKATLKAKSPRRKTTKPAKKKPVVIENRPFPKWLRLVIALFIVVLILSISYLLFIRPYAYRWKPCYGLKAYDVCIPCCYEVHGIDVSHHQGTIDWLQIVESKNTSFPIEFVFMKATEGGDHLDTTYFKNFENAGKSNIIRGVYHFFSPYTDPHKQADFFIKTVELSKGDLPHVLDIEVIGRASKADLVNNAKVWLSRVEKHYGVKPIIYTSYNLDRKSVV